MRGIQKVSKMDLYKFTGVVKEVKGEKISLSKETRKPILIEGEYTFNMDAKLKYDLDILCQDLKQDDDALIIIVAPEGSGKTILETQIGYYISKKMKTSWNEDNVHFDAPTYQTFSLNNPRGTVVALDESRRALNKMRGMTGNNVEFNNFLSECRSNNQAHIVVLPAYSDLEKYVAIHRAKYIIQVVKLRDKETKKIVRGTFKIISTKSKSMLLQAWKGGYKEFPNNMVTHIGKFENVLCLDKKKYDNKKETAKKERYISNEIDKTEVDPLKKLVLEYHNEGKSLRDIAKTIKKSKDTVNRWIKEVNGNLSNVS